VRRAAAIVLLALLHGCAVLCPAGPQPRIAAAAVAAYAEGRAEQAAGRHAQAVKAYKHALRLEPGYAAARNAIAVVYAERGHRVFAVDMLRELARDVPRDRDHAYVFNNLGYAQMLAGDPAAGDALRTALALDPTAARPAANLRQLIMQPAAK
jgi:tetratricopeptide (TPR) repeat protein